VTSRRTQLYEDVWLKIVPRDWRILAASAAACAVLTMLFAYLAAQGENYAVPDRAHLREVQGTVRLIRVNRYDIEFRLDPGTNVFEYPAKARKFKHVAAALRKGGRATVLVDGRTFGEGAAGKATIYALSINGTWVRPFDDVARAFRADNQVFYWLIALFAPIALALAASARHEYRSTPA
jgi:hypothetical protein